LSSVVLSLAPGDIGDITKEDRIPYVALENAVGWETIETGTLEHAGLYCVEESSTNECKRRLIFLENQQFVQTEVRLNITTATAPSSGSSSKSSNNKKGKGKKSTTLETNAPLVTQPLFMFDHTYLDDHHRAMLVGYLGGDLSVVREGYQQLSKASRAQLQTDTMSQSERLELLNVLNLSTDVCAAWLPLDYLRTLQQQATSSSPPPLPLPSSAPTPSPRTLLIGLGGGSLAMAIQKYFPSMCLDIVELVPGLEDIAIKHFGFIKSSRTRVLVGDGLLVLNSMIQHNNTHQQQHLGPTQLFQYDCIIIDVDSKDPSQGLSAPPREFITPEMIRNYHSLLTARGVLSLNVVARNQLFFEQLSASLCQEFLSSTSSPLATTGNVYRIISSSEHVNVTLHATATGATLHSGNRQQEGSGNMNNNSNKKKKKSGSQTVLTPLKGAEKMQRKELENWLQVGVSSVSFPHRLLPLSCRRSR
jgi:spermidine synthase